MAKYLSNRQKNLKIGIVSYTESNTVLEVTGKVGIGTTNATTNLDVNGNIRLRGILYDKDNQPGTAGQILVSTGSGIDWANGAPASAISGITIREEGTIVGTADSVSSINFVGPNVTATASGAAATITIADYVSSSGVATYATSSGISTNLKGGLVGNIPYQSAADTTTFLSNGTSGFILQSNGVGNAPSWVAAAPASAISGITIREEGSVAGTANSVSSINFVGPNVTATASGAAATITIADYVSNSGVSTSVSGGIASVTSLNVSGVSTISVNSSTDALRITQTGAGNALVVEDSANPDTTPFVVTGTGSVGIGTTNPSEELHIVSSQPLIRFTETDGAADNRNWNVGVNAQEFYWQAQTDASVGGGNLFKMTRSAEQIQTFEGRNAGNTWFITNNNTQRVGIGTSIASAVLDVRGNPWFSPNTTGVKATALRLGRFVDGVNAAFDILTDDNTGDDIEIQSNRHTGKIRFSRSSPSGIQTTFILDSNYQTGTSISIADTTGTSTKIKLDEAGNTFFNNSGAVLVGSATSTGTASQPLQVTGGAYVSGSVGIGTTNPLSKLHVEQTTEGEIARFRASDSTRYLTIKSFNSGFNGSGIEFDATSSAGVLRFSTNSIEKVRITTDGNVGVGTNNPQDTLQVNGDLRLQAAIPEIKFRSGGNVNQYYIGANISDSVDGGFIIGEGSGITGGSTRFLIDTNGNVGINSSSPTSRLDVVGNIKLTGGAYVSGDVGIGTTNPTSKLSVVGDGNFTGVVTATTFIGALTGTATTASSVTVNSVGLGTHTYGDYVKDITGTANQITVTSGTGEGSSPTLSVPNQFTAPQDVTVTRDLQVNRDLNVNGNITIGGTSATLFSQELKVFDPDIVLGFRTDGSGNDVSTDNTANHGGIAIASTEGTPLISLYDVGVGETNPATYKKFMWFKSGTFSGLGTDAWLSNYAIGIGSTQVPNGVRLAAGGMQVTDSTLSISQLNISGVSTFTGAVSFGTSAYFGDSDKLIFGDGGDLEIYHDGNNSVIRELGTGLLSIQSSGLNFLKYGTSEYFAQFVSDGSVSLYYDNTKEFETTGAGVTVFGTTETQQLVVSGVSTFQNNVFLGDNDSLYFGDGNDLRIWHNGTHSNIADVGTGDLYLGGNNNVVIADGALSETKAKFITNGSVELYYDNTKEFETTGYGATVFGTLQSQKLNVTGVSTFSGITTHTEPLFGTQASFTGVVTASSFSGNASSATYADNAGIATFATNAGVSTSVIGGIGSITQLSVSGITTTGTLNVGTGGTIITTTTGGLVGINTTNPQSALDVRGTITIGEGAVGINSISSTTDIQSWYYTNKSFASGDTSPQAIYVGASGTALYVAGNTANTIFQYTLSTPYDVSTAGAATASFLTTSQESVPTGIDFHPDGTKMFLVGQTSANLTPAGDYVHEYSLSTPWNVSSVGYTTSYNVTEDGSPVGVAIGAAGTAMYMVGGANDTLYQYTLTTPYSLAAGNVTYANKSLVLSAAPLVETGPQDLTFNSTGTVLWIVGSTNDRIYEFRLGTAWDISTAVFYDDVYIGFNETAPLGLHVIPEQNVAYIVGSDSSGDRVFQYSTNTPAIEIASSGISSVSSIVLNNETRVKDKLYVKGLAHFDTNIVTQGNIQVDGSTTITGNITVSGGSISAGNNATTLLGGNTTTNITMASGQTTGTLAIGAAAQTGTMTVGLSTASQTTNIQAGANASGTQKTINLGTGGLAGSRTLITVGSAVAGAASTVTIPSPTNLLIGTATTTGTASQPLQVSGGAYVSGNLGVGNTNGEGIKLFVSQGAPAANRPVALITDDGTIPTMTSGATLRISNDGSINSFALLEAESSAGKLVFTNAGNLGIGTTNPQVSLDIVGNVRVAGVSTFSNNINIASGIITTTGSNGVGIGSFLRLKAYQPNEGGEVAFEYANGNTGYYLDVGAGNIFRFSNYDTAGTYTFVTNSTEKVRISNAGNLGINTTNPQDTLDVGVGTIRLYNKSVPSRFSQIYQDGALTFKNSAVGDDFQFLASSNSLMVLKGSGPLILPGTASLTGTASQLLQVTGGAYVSGSVGIGTTNPTSTLTVTGDGNFTGVVTATSFRGDGSQLTGITASGSVSISTNTTNSNLLIPYATSFGSTTGLGATSLLVYNPSSGNAGIGTTNPTSKLSVVGDANFTGVVTATTFVGALSGTATSTTNIPNLSGDVSSNNTVTTLATVNSNVGTYGDAGAIPSITVNAKGLVTGVTTVAPNNGQLSLAVSGTGLSGSATFTANQSGSSTFTVTSNATDANTPSTIVARDPSGNFSAGTITANLTGTATTATNLADAANITTGIINSARLSGTYNINVSYASTAGIATVAQGLTGTPNITVGVVTATSFVKSGGTSSQFLKADGSVDSSTYLTTTGSGTNLTGIVTSIVAGTNITVSGSTGQVTINSTATGGGAALDILEVMLFA